MMKSDLVTKLSGLLAEKKLSLVTAESCTGGMIAAAMTDLPGSSRVFERGFVAYSNAAKTELLGVPEILIERHGAVSLEVAEAMAAGALRHSKAQTAIAVTGIAGPDGGSAEKPVGLIYIAVAAPGDLTARAYNFSGDRSTVREQARDAALIFLLDRLSRPQT